MGQTFTFEEAQAIVPRLGGLLQQAREASQRAGQLDDEMQSLSQRIFLSGGMHVDVAAAARRRAERDKSIQEAKSTIEEIEDTGAQIVESEEGALELPCVVEGRTVLLCWALGDARIERWREDEPGSTSRRIEDGPFQRERPN